MVITCTECVAQPCRACATLNDPAAVLHSSPDGVRAEMRDDIIVLIKVVVDGPACIGVMS